MTLQLHRPDGEGGLEPRPVVDPTGATSSSRPLGHGPRGDRLPTLKNPEMNPTSRLRSVLFWAGPRRSLTFVLARRSATDRASGRACHRYRTTPVRRAGASRDGVGASPILGRDMRFLNRFVDSNDREIRRTPTPGRRDQRPRGRVTRPSPTTEIRAAFDELRAEILEAAVARRAVRGRAPPPRSRAPPRAEEGAPQARERAAPGGPRRRPAGGLRDDPRGDEADARDAPLRRPADGRRGPPPGQDRRDADRRGQDPRRAAGRDPQRAGRPRRPRRHRQRLPRPARPAVDGPGLPLPGRQRRDDHPRRARSCSSPATRPTDERLLNLRPVTRREAYAADVTYGTNNEFGFDYLRDNMVLELDQRVQRERSFAIVDEVDNILIDEARTPLIISGQAEESADLYFTFARLVPRLKERPEGDEEGGDYFVDLKDKAVSSTEEGIDEDGGLARRREHVRRRPAPRPPLRAGAAGPRALQARPRLHRQGRRDHHRRRVHRPPDARPALERGPPPGDRGQGGPAGPARERDPRHDHLPELLPAVRQAGRHDRHGDDRGRGVPQDLQARGRRHPDPPRDDPRRRRRTSSSATRRPSSTRSSTRSSRCRRRAGRSSSARSRSRSPRCSPRCSSGAASSTRSSTPSSTRRSRGSSPRPAGPAPSRSPRTWPAAARTSCSAATRPASPPRSLHKRGLNPAEVDDETLRGGPRRGQGHHRGGPRAGRRRRRPAHHRHRAARLAAHRQPAPRPRRPPGRPRARRASTCRSRTT